MRCLVDDDGGVDDVVDAFVANVDLVVVAVEEVGAVLRAWKRESCARSCTSSTSNFIVAVS